MVLPSRIVHIEPLDGLDAFAELDPLVAPLGDVDAGAFVAVELEALARLDAFAELDPVRPARRARTS